MKRCLIAFLFLVVAGSLHVSLVAYQKFGVMIERTFTFKPDRSGGGFGSPGGLVDVIGTEWLPDWEPQARLIVTRVLVLEVKVIDDTTEAITLRVTPFEAEQLEQAQSRGTLRWILRPPPPTLEEQVREWLGLESRLTTLAREFSDR